MSPADTALLDLHALLRARSYHFVTPTPATHARVLARPDRREARDLADMLGWSLPFAPGRIDPELVALLDRAEAIEPARDLLRSRLRASTLGDQLFLHSAHPTQAEDSVFFGPDSYRFADLIAAELARDPAPAGAHVVDIGTGAGVGGLVAARVCRDARITMTDVNPQALRLARVNAQAAGITVETIEGADLRDVADPIDVALANPPYLVDEGRRAYRDGGGMLGGQVSLDMARMAVARLAPGGRLILYTGSAIVRGEDALRQALAALAAEHGLGFRYRELDPDVFGEELECPAYAEADRIAVVAAVLRRS